MRAEVPSTRQDFPWKTVIRSEMETWMPERLPLRFRPRSRPSVPGAWRPLAVAVGVVLAGAAVYTLSLVSDCSPAVVRVVFGTTLPLAPAPTPVPTRAGVGRSTPKPAATTPEPSPTSQPSDQPGPLPALPPPSLAESRSIGSLRRLSRLFDPGCW